MVKELNVGKLYQLTKDFIDCFGTIPKGTIMLYIGKNLGFAKFKPKKKVKGYKAQDIAIPSSKVFKIIKEEESFFEGWDRVIKSSV